MNDFRQNPETRAPLATRLIEADASVLCLIDMQDSFFHKYPKELSRSVIERAVWLLRVAQLLDIPAVAMGEDIDQAGPLTAEIATALPDGTTVFDKNVFGLGHQSDILAAVEATGRHTAVLIGVETDVCVAHSALSLLQAGFDVAVVSDATATTAGGQDIGLARIRAAGGVVCSVKSLYFEWTRSVSNIVALLARDPEIETTARPDDLLL